MWHSLPETSVANPDASERPRPAWSHSVRGIRAHTRGCTWHCWGLCYLRDVNNDLNVWEHKLQMWVMIWTSGSTHFRCELWFRLLAIYNCLTHTYDSVSYLQHKFWKHAVAYPHHSKHECVSTNICVKVCCVHTYTQLTHFNHSFTKFWARHTVS